MTHLILLLTGITDAPLQDLGGLTPLQKARTPEMDLIAKKGGCLAASPPKGGGVETSFLALLGIDEETSSAPLEAAALGLSLSERQTYYSARLVSAGGGVLVEVGDTLIGDKEGSLLCSALTGEFQGEGIRFVHVEGSHCLLITDDPYGPLPGPGPSPFEVVGQSLRTLLPKKIRAKLTKILERAAACLAEHEVNQLRSDLEEVPINALWILEGGSKPAWMERAHTFEGYEIWSSTSIIRGVAKGLGIPCKELTRSLRMDREIKSLVRQLEGDLPETLIIELPYLWESTYKGDLLEKIKRIEFLDRHLIGPLAQQGYELTCLPLRHTDIRMGGIISGALPVLTSGEGASLRAFDEPCFASLPTRPIGEVLGQPAAV